MFWIRAGVIDGIKPLLENYFGLNWYEFVAQTNFNFDRLSDKDHKYPLDSVIYLLNACVQYTGCNYFSVLLAYQQSRGSLGVIELIGEHSTSLLNAIEDMIKNISLNATGVHWQLVKDKHYSQLICEINSSEKTDITVIFALAQAYHLFSTITEDQWRPARVYFSIPQVNNVAVWRKFFGQYLYFNCDFNGFIIENSMLSKRLTAKSNNNMMKDLIHDYIKLSGQHHQGDRLQQIQQNIRSNLLLKQHCSLETIAHTQNLTPRAIQVYLKKKGLSYQHLLDQERYNLARNLLTTSEQSISSIALLTGFSESAAFSRAFKKRIGITPSAYRKRY